MMNQQILTGLKAPSLDEARAREIGQMAFMHWLSCLPGAANYQIEAARAHQTARDLRNAHPAAVHFCALIEESLQTPLQPLALALPKPRRRGGAQRRRPRD